MARKIVKAINDYEREGEGGDAEGRQYGNGY